MIPVALELEHAVDEVLEDARPGDRPVLRHMADQEQRDAGLLPDAEQAAGCLSHLRDRSRSRPDVGRVERLHRVDHADCRALALERRADCVQVGLGKDLDPLRAAEPRRPQLDLRRRLLAGDEQRSAVAGDRRERHQQERRLPHSWLPADEHERGGDEPAAEDPVELCDAGRDPLGLLHLDVDEPQHRARSGALRSSRRRRWRLVHERPEAAAARAAAEPTPGRLTAFGAGELRSRLGHGAPTVGRDTDVPCADFVTSHAMNSHNWQREFVS